MPVWVEASGGNGTGTGNAAATVMPEMLMQLIEPELLTELWLVTGLMAQAVASGVDMRRQPAAQPRTMTPAGEGSGVRGEKDSRAKLHGP